MELSGLRRTSRRRLPSLRRRQKSALMLRSRSSRPILLLLGNRHNVELVEWKWLDMEFNRWQWINGQVLSCCEFLGMHAHKLHSDTCIYHSEWCKAQMCLYYSVKFKQNYRMHCAPLSPSLFVHALMFVFLETERFNSVSHTLNIGTFWIWGF